MEKQIHPLLTASLLLFIVLCPFSSEWLHRDSKTILRPLPQPPGQSVVKDKSVFESPAYWNALRFLREHRFAFKNKRYITIIDYTKPSTTKRFYLIDMESGAVRKYLVAHGKNSGWVYATHFSNLPESFQSSKGFFKTGNGYSGKLGICLELHGLEKGVNDNALSRGIIIHGAHYASGNTIAVNHGRLGRSLGCPAIPKECVREVIDKIKGGSLLYIYGK